MIDHEATWSRTDELLGDQVMKKLIDATTIALDLEVAVASLQYRSLDCCVATIFELPPAVPMVGNLVGLIADFPLFRWRVYHFFN
jgi:hypothetical protein